jgi:hypothetical protein
MKFEPAKLTDSLERELGAREMAAQQGAAFEGSLNLFRPLISAAQWLATAIRALRSQARNAKVDYAAG